MNVIQHDLKVVLHPEEKRFTAEDSITLPEALLPEFRLQLHKGLSASSPTQGVIMSAEADPGPAKSYRVRLPRGVKTSFSSTAEASINLSNRSERSRPAVSARRRE
jgi:hypothetical protein